MKVLVTGGRGFVGNFLTGLIVARGDRVTVVSRRPESVRTARVNVEVAGWLPDLSKFDAVVHLAGEPVFGARWNDAQKERIRASRVDSTRRIVAALAEADPRPRVLVCASAVGYYGDRGDEVLGEDAPAGGDFLAGVCREWEAAAQEARGAGVRPVSARIGVVLGLGGGALPRLARPVRLGLGGTIGRGRQWMSWVHVKDLGRLILHAIDTESLEGPLNATAPQPVTNRELTRTLGRLLRRPTLLPAPPFALRLALGEVARLLTDSQRCSADKALASGFEFGFPALDGALRQLLHR